MVFVRRLVCLEEERKKHYCFIMKSGRIISHVFHHRGRPIVNYYKAWHKACDPAKLADRIPHDIRRTVVRNMVRAGVVERVAMQMTGHKTRAVFDRYHIVSDSDLKEAAKKLSLATVLATVTKRPSRRSS
jgi:integrase